MLYNFILTPGINYKRNSRFVKMRGGIFLFFYGSGEGKNLLFYIAILKLYIIYKKKSPRENRVKALRTP